MKKTLPYLIRFWKSKAACSAEQEAWLCTFAKALKVKRGQLLFEPNEPQRKHHLYFVCSGLMGMAWWDEEGNRRLERFLLPGDSALSCLNLYTDTPKRCGLLALRPSTLLRIPAESLREYKESCREAETLCDVLEYNKLRQFREKSGLMLIKNEVARYIAFYHRMKPLQMATSQPQQTEYLNISKMSITRGLQIIRQQR